MNKIFIKIFLFFSIVTIHAQKQGNFQIKNNSSWRINFVYDSFDSIHHDGDDIFTYFINGDTDINAYYYYKIYKSGIAYYGLPFSYSNVYVGALRDTNNRFFFIKKNENIEMTLFDFNIKIGDTIVSQLNGQISIIENIDTLSDGRKVFSGFSTHQWGGKCSAGQIIEGIGNSGGLLEEMPCIHPGLQEHYLICYKEGDDILYQGSYAIGHCNTDNLNSRTISLKPDIKVYPIPANDIIHVENNFEQISTFELFDATGELVYIKRHDNYFLYKSDLDIDNLKPGVYILRIKGYNTMINKKIIIQ